MKQTLRPIPTLSRPVNETYARNPVVLLDRTLARLLDGDDVGATIDIFSDGLWWLRDTSGPARWPDFVSLARAHPLMSLLHEDPLLRRAFVKPRGYAGDAPLLDLIYDGRAGADALGASAVGLAMLDRDLSRPFCKAIRERRDFMAGLIDHVASATVTPEILVAACGHLREAAASCAVRENRLGRIVALDHDADSLAVVARDLAGFPVETVHRSIKAVTDGTFEYASFDMIYAAGLYESLGSRFAAALTVAFFDLLRPGGRLVVGNFAATLQDRAYLEAAGDWFLIYRDAAELLALADGIDRHETASRRVSTAASPEILYLEIRKRGAARR